jgi:DNA polymerase-3 subunit beta
VEVSINPKNFLERLRLVGAFTGRRYPLPILETVRLEAHVEGQASLRASDLDADISVSVPVLKVIQPGVAQLPCAQVVKTLGGLRCGRVVLRETDPETLPMGPGPNVPTRRVSVETAQGTVALPTFDPANFPLQRLDPVTAEVKLPAWRFVRLIVRTQHAADEHATRFALGGCFLDFADGKLTSAATNGRCLAEAEEAATGSGLLPPKTTIVDGEERPLAPVVPRKALSSLVATLRLMENAELTLGFTAEGRFQATAQGLAFTARLPEGRFPNWKEVFPESASTSVRVEGPARLVKGLKDLVRFTTREARAMTLTLVGHALTLAVDNDQAKAQVEVRVRNLSAVPDHEVSLCIDPRSLLDFLDGAGRSFDLWFPSEKGVPLVCQAEGHRYAVMPMERAEAPDHGAPGAKEVPPHNPQEELSAEEAQIRTA